MKMKYITSNMYMAIVVGPDAVKFFGHDISTIRGGPRTMLHMIWSSRRGEAVYGVPHLCSPAGCLGTVAGSGGTVYWL